MKKIISAVLCLFMIASCFGCGGKDEQKSEVWSIVNTEKILADKAYDSGMKSSKSIDICMAKGEYESGQLLITAGKDINNIEFIANNLSCGNEILSAENIKIYFQKYVDIQEMSSPKAPIQLGKWPDALVPLDKIKNKNEDKIKKGQNQGLWITVRTPVDCASGTYTGNFELKLDNDSIKVPVKVKVWDFVVPQKKHQKTTFNNFREDLIGGELDNTPEMMELYYDYFLDYNISLYDLPLLDGTSETYVKQAKKYAQDDRCNAYNMEYQYLPNTPVSYNGMSKIIYETNWDNIKERLLLLANESRPGLNLFEKLYFWDQSTDEPDGGLDRIFEANYKQDRFNKLLDEVVAELGDNFDYTAHGITKKDILYLENVVTAKESPKLPAITSFCPMINDLETAERRDVYKKLKEEDPRRTLWWYDAWIPQYPYPNYRIEESSLGSRVMGWMQKDYDLDGLLYWGTSVYVAQGNPGGVRPRDPYQDPYSFQAISMDGCLTYPGRNYDIMGPVGSIRLDSIRDGLEDYEYLWLLEDLLKDVEIEYGVSLEYDKMMRNIFDSLYTGVIPNNNANNLFNARQEVAEMIELLISDAKGAIVIDKIDAMQNKAYISIYSADNAIVKIDNVTLDGVDCKNGKKYSYEKSLSNSNNFVDVTFEINNKVIHVRKNAGKKSYALAIVNDDTVMVTASQGHPSDPKEHILMQKNQDNTEVSSDALKLAISKYETDNEIAQIVYNPEVFLAKNKFFSDVSPSQMDKLKFSIFNASNVNKKMSINLYSGVSSSNIKEFILKPGINNVEVNQIYLNNWQFLSKAETIAMAFEKCENSSADVYYIYDAYYTIAE